MGCSESSTDNSFHFCYLYIREQAEAWACVPIFVIGVALLIWSSRQFHKNKKLQKKMNSIIKLTYISIIVSLIAYLMKFILSEVVFWIEYNNNYNQQFNGRYLLFSKYQFVLDNISVFAMQSTVLLVPANWFRNIIAIFRKWSTNDRLSPQQKDQILNSYKFEEKSYNILIIYGIIRIVTLIALLLPFIFLTGLCSLSLVADIILVWWLLESAFMTAMLTLGYFSLRNNKKLMQILEEDDYNRMKCHYILLIICTVLRLISDLVFVITYLYYVKNSVKCYVHQEGSSIIFDVINILMEAFFTFYLSVFFVLQIYKIQDNSKRDQLKLKSLIQEQTNLEKQEVRSNFLSSNQ